MFNQVLTVEQRLEKNTFKIMQHDTYESMSQVIMIGDKTVCDKTPTACTNGRDERYGRDYCDKLTDPEFRGVIVHENKHKMYMHLTIWPHLMRINAQLANMAMDYVIDLEIVDENPPDSNGVRFAELPKGCCLDERFRGMDTQQVFNILLKERGDEEGDGDGDGSGDGSGDGRGNGSGDGGDQPLDDHDWEGAKDLSDEEKEKLAEEIDNAIQDGMTLAGKTGSGGTRALSDLAKPQVDWRQVTRDFLTETIKGSDYTTYRRPNRRYFGDGYYLPSGLQDRLGELVIANDMSGSIGTREIGVVMAEQQSFCQTVKPSKVHVIYWDTEVARHEQYTGVEIESITQNTKPSGGGGTDVTCVPVYMAEHSIKPQAAIVITDGHLYAGWGNWDCRVLWIIIDNEHAKPPHGTFVHVKSRDL